MKILMPYKSRNGIRLDSKVINGGIEMFAKNLMKVIPEIIPIEITEEDRKKRKTRNIIENAIGIHNPDFAISNEATNTMAGIFQEFGIPLVVIVHECKEREIRNVELGVRLTNMHDRGAHIYFVSQSQYEFHKAMYNRIHKKVLPDPTGIIPSAFCPESFAPSNRIDYDCGTVGRTSIEKDPFYVHKMAYATELTSVVLTDILNSTKSNSANITYYENSKKWKPPQMTFRNLPHDKTLEILATMGVYISTSVVESWGITAMEALGHGVPLILLTDKTFTHSSEDIAALPDHYIKIRKNEKFPIVADAVKRLLDMTTFEKRIEISEMTKAKNSAENWRKIIENMVNKRLDTPLPKIYNLPTLRSFLK